VGVGWDVAADSGAVFCVTSVDDCEEVSLAVYSVGVGVGSVCLMSTATPGLISIAEGIEREEFSIVCFAEVPKEFSPSSW